MITKMAKSTQSSMKCAKNMLVTYLDRKGIPQIPIDKSQLDNVLSNFWPSLRKTNGDKFRASSLLTLRQNLRAAISAENAIDIIEDLSFSQSNKLFGNFVKSLKNEGLGYVKHTPDINKTEIEKIVTKLDINCPKQLQYLTWIFIMLFFCRRGIENLTKIKKHFFIVTEIGGKK